MAGRSRPSYLKKQKEEQRRTRALRKREERTARKQAAQLNKGNPEAWDALEPTGEDASDEDATSEDAADEGSL